MDTPNLMFSLRVEDFANRAVANPNLQELFVASSLQPELCSARAHAHNSSTNVLGLAENLVK